MKVIHAIYEDGVFKPTERVDLPERCRVRVEPEEPESAEQSSKIAEAKIREILSREYDTGDRDASERIDEHQP